MFSSVFKIDLTKWDAESLENKGLFSANFLIFQPMRTDEDTPLSDDGKTGNDQINSDIMIEQTYFTCKLIQEASILLDL